MKSLVPTSRSCQAAGTLATGSRPSLRSALFLPASAGDSFETPPRYSELSNSGPMSSLRHLTAASRHVRKAAVSKSLSMTCQPASTRFLSCWSKDSAIFLSPLPRPLADKRRIPINLHCTRVRRAPSLQPQRLSPGLLPHVPQEGLQSSNFHCGQLGPRPSPRIGF